MKSVTAQDVQHQPAQRHRSLQDKGPALKSWTQGLAWVFAVWACSRALLTVVGVLAREWIGPQNNVGNVYEFFGIGTGHQWLDIWGAWDTRWYYDIAENGYSATMSADGYANYAFFPLYPWLTRITADLVGDTYVAGLIVSNLAILLGATVFFRLLELERNTAAARRGVLFLFLFPTSYIFSCMMTESLFLSLTITSWYFARRRVWWLACACAGLTSMTRSFGVLLGPVLLWEYLRQRQYRLKAFNVFEMIFSVLRCLDLRVLWFALIPAGLAVFMWVCWQTTDNPLAFVDIQSAWRGDQRYSNPLSMILWGLSRIGAYQDNRLSAVYSYGIVFGLLTGAATFAMVVYGRRRIDPALTTWSLVTVLLYFCTGTVALPSMPRYMVTIFPQYMVFALHRFNRLSLLATMVFLILIQAITMSLWTNAFGFAI